MNSTSNVEEPKLCVLEPQAPVIFVSATRIGSDDLISEMGNVLASSSLTIAQSDWGKRLRFLLQNASVKEPKIVLVLDGLNERPSFEWRRIFDKFRIAPFIDSVAVMMSCRTGYWCENYDKYYGAAVCSWQLPPFNDQELDEALSKHKLSRDAFSDRVLQLVAKPRYFDMAVRLKDRMAEAGDDVTVDRLIYEDWKDKTERKCDSSTKISHDEFHAIIREISGRFNGRIDTNNLARELSAYGDQASIRSELVSSGILHSVGGGRYEVASQHLVLGFGLLLANEVEESCESEHMDTVEVIAQRLGPHSDGDRIVQICAMALFHSLLTEGYPDAGRIALFRAWIAERNLDEADLERIYAYFPLRPNIYFQIAEMLWSGSGDNREVQDYFMAAFLQRQHFSRVRDEMVSVFERWLGYVHLYGWRGYFEHEPEKREELLATVEHFLGKKVELGPLELLGHRLEVVDDINLLRLGQVAVAVISHLNQLSFTQALIAGLIAASVMDGTSTEFGWTLRTADSEIKNILLHKATHLISIGNPQGFRAAYKILSALCNEESLELRDAIPSEYHAKNAWIEALGDEEICDSIIISWTDDNYLECINKTRLSAIAIASKLKNISQNPSNQLPSELISKINNVFELIDFSQVRSHVSLTREDYFIRDIEPALCAYCPELYQILAKSLTALLPQREGCSKWYVAAELSKHLPVLDTEDRKIILDTWRNGLSIDDNENGFCESMLFYFVIFDLKPVEQFELTIKREQKNGYFVDHPPCFRIIQLEDINLIESIIEKNCYNKYNPTIAILWYLSRALLKLTDSFRKKILDWFNHSEDDIIRGYCLQIICNTYDENASKFIINSGWRYSTDNIDSFENEWGSVLLCNYGHNIPYEELAGRILPKHYGYAVRVRGGKNSEIELYIQLLHTTWCHIAYPSAGTESLLRHVRIKVCGETGWPRESWTIDVDDGQSIKLVNYTWGGQVGNVPHERIKRALDPKAAEDAWQSVHRQVVELFDSELRRGNQWVNLSFYFENFKEVLLHDDQTWRQWLTPVLSNEPAGLRQRAFCQGFYEKLCEALLDVEPETGAKLFNIIYEDNYVRITDSNTGIRTLNYSLFNAPESSEVAILKRSIFETCTNDNDLFEFAIVAQECGQSKWLESLIAEQIASDRDYDKARALQLLGYMDEENALMRIQEWISCHRRSWLMDVARNSLRNFQRNKWAKDWFGRFEESESRLEAWAAFRLFLQCVDRRYWIWERRLDGSSWKFDILSSSYGTIRKATKENEKNMKDKFLCHDVKNDQLWPWMKRYLSH